MKNAINAGSRWRLKSDGSGNSSPAPVIRSVKLPALSRLKQGSNARNAAANSYNGLTRKGKSFTDAAVIQNARLRLMPNLCPNPVPNAAVCWLNTKKAKQSAPSAVTAGNQMVQKRRRKLRSGTPSDRGLVWIPTGVSPNNTKTKLEWTAALAVGFVHQLQAEYLRLRPSETRPYARRYFLPFVKGG